MKVLLVNVTRENPTTITPPIGLWSIRSCLESLGADVDICHTSEGWLPNNESWDVIGVSGRFSIDDMQYRTAVSLAMDRCAKVVTGGFHAAFSDSIRGVVRVRGGGEAAMADVCGYKPPLTLDELPFPEWSVGEMVSYWIRDRPHDWNTVTRKWMPIETSRGCWRSCGFCAVTKFWGKWQGHSLSWMEAHLDYLQGKGVEELLVEDDNLTRDWNRFGGLMELFASKGMAWSTPNGIELRSLVDNDFEPSDLKQSGCWRLSLPFETGCKSTAEGMHLGDKFFEYEEAYELVVRLREAGIKTCGFFIIGWPTETMEDMQRTIMYANALPLDDRHIYIATPYPGTKLWDMATSDSSLGNYTFASYKTPIIDGETWGMEKVAAMQKHDRYWALRRKKLDRQGGGV